MNETPDLIRCSTPVRDAGRVRWQGTAASYARRTRELRDRAMATPPGRRRNVRMALAVSGQRWSREHYAVARGERDPK